MDEQKKLKKTTVNLPPELIDQLKVSAKQHYRSCNGELMFAIEQYLLSGKHTMK